MKSTQSKGFGSKQLTAEVSSMTSTVLPAGVTRGAEVIGVELVLALRVQCNRTCPPQDPPKQTLGLVHQSSSVHRVIRGRLGLALTEQAGVDGAVVAVIADLVRARAGHKGAAETQASSTVQGHHRHSSCPVARSALGTDR